MIHLWHLLPFAGGRWDIVYIPWNSAAIGFLPLFDLGMPVVVSCRGSQVSVAPLNPERAVHKAGLTTIFKRAAAVHCVSEAIVADALLYGLDPSKADVIRPAVDPDFFYPSEQQSADRGRFRLITTGTLIWRKGYEYMLAALRRLHDQEIDAHLTIIGDGPERQRVLYTIHDLGLEQQVVLLGRLAPERVREQLWQADAFVLSSVSEGISNAVLEAMACGLPVVVTNCGGMREAVTDGVEGFVVPVRDAAALATALSRLSASSALRRQMGHAARNRIIAQFTLDQQVKQFVDLFEMVVQKHPHEILRSCTPVS
jgi:glycosyltransferase involved in cell wall biosynthesis